MKRTIEQKPRNSGAMTLKATSRPTCPPSSRGPRYSGIPAMPDSLVHEIAYLPAGRSCGVEATASNLPRLRWISRLPNLVDRRTADAA
jgi:hypothetical protein